MLGNSPIVAFVGVSDAARARSFYRDTLGLRMVSEDEFALVFDVQGTMLRVTPAGKIKPAQYTVLGWAVKNISTTARSMVSAGVTFERYGFLEQDDLGIWTAPGGAKVAWFKDPDGNVLSISQH
jgi:catechol 2,3-dioxygenase-like lactoylglutathione lyase family enzyme